MEFRCRRGTAVRLEDALGLFPELGAAADVSGRLIYSEDSPRLLHGDRPALESYRKRFPRQYDDLVQLVRDHPVQDTPVPPRGQSHTVAGISPHAPATVPPEGTSAPAASVPD